MSATMKAVIYKPEDPTGVADAELPKPEATKLGSVLVRVRAAAANPVDYKLPTVPVIKRSTYGRPVGLDLAGVVEAVGPGVENVKVGDEVFGNSTAGTIAEFCLAEAVKIAPKPAKLTFEEAAALPTVALTSLQALDKVQAGKDKRVLIIGGSGGCGALGVQIAKAMGAHVTATCSGKNVDKVRGHGADDVVDYTSQEIPREPLFDCIYDTVTSPDDINYSGLKRTHLAQGGKYAQINGSPGDWMKYGLSTAPITKMFCSSTMLLTNHSAEDLGRIAAFADEGAVRPQVQEVLPFSAAGVQQAFALLKGRRATGKLVFTIGA